MKLTGRTAMVTGGSGDIGGAICRALAADVEALDRASITVQLDQRDGASIEAAATEVADRFGGCDILVNCGAWNIGIRSRTWRHSTTPHGIVCSRPTCEALSSWLVLFLNV